MNNRRTTRPMRLLTRLVDSGLEVIASHVLTILGGPMERMADWGQTRRRPCIVTFIQLRFQYFRPGYYYYKSGPAIFVARDHPVPLAQGMPDDAAILGSRAFENFRAIESTPRDYAY